MIEINKYIYEGKNMADSKLKKEIERGSYKNCIRIRVQESIILKE